MSWRPATSLTVLRNQLDSAYPGWLFLGYLGDAAHASVPSDHNPNSAGVVCALDIGPGGGLQIHSLADNLAANPHPDLKYIISNRRIAEWQYGFKWRAYNGSDPHNTHIHVSVGRGSDGQSKPPYDDTNKWNIKGAVMASQDKVDDLTVRLGYNIGLFRQPADSEINSWVNSGVTVEQFMRAILASAEHLAYQASAANTNVTQAEIDDLAKKADDLEQAIKKVNK